MTRRRLFMAGGAAAFLLLAAGGAIYGVVPAYRNHLLEESYERALSEIMAGLSLDQKVGQLLHVGMPGTGLSASVRRELERRPVGGVILFGHNLRKTEQIRKLTTELQELSVRSSGVPLWISTDQEGGRVERLPADAVAQFPSALAIGQARRPDLAYAVGFTTANSLRSVGVELVLAPVLDVNNNPLNPVINTRSFGSDPIVVRDMGSMLARGIRDAGAVPVVKHFPGHGDTTVDSHLDLPRIDRTLADLKRTELPPFEHAIRDGAEVVMSAHILYPALDAERPATLSAAVLTGLLRENLGFRGIVMTDAMEMHAVARRYPWKESAKLAFRAGADIILLTGMGPYVAEMHAALLSAFRSGEIRTDRLDAAVRRQLDLKLRRGLFIRHPSSKRFSVEIAAASARTEARIAERARELRLRFPELNRDVSLAAVTALRSSFVGLSTAEQGSARLFARTRTVAATGRELMGAARTSNGGVGTAARRMASAKPGAVWLVEFREREVPAWNALVRRTDRLPNVRLIGLYPDNPYLVISVPKNGAVLASYSPTVESLRSLVVRALDGRAVQKAALVLPDAPAQTALDLTLDRASVSVKPDIAP